MRRTVVAGGYAALLLRERRAAMLAMVRKKGMCARVAFADGDDGGGKASTSRRGVGPARSMSTVF